ncbi:MAG: DUF2971 domain-containing protein [Bacteroidales bacterium]|jgi:hypothetical protein|nr:DUF2971 domain-containing protein [Bacteroidales bacterium]MCI2145048.1 DUF2971 domain-containing protein [Bacteroidales bacterium]
MLAYKYRSNDYLERDLATLTENCIYFAPFNTLNDPNEGICNDAISKMLNVVDPFSKEDTKRIRDSLQKVLSFKDSIGVYSMSKTPFNFNMWVNYANNNKGFCIEYDFDKLCEETQFPLKRDINVINVDYRKRFPTITIDDIQDENVFLTKLYGTKLLKWKQEQEVRIIKDHYGKKTYHPSALKAIYFGEKCEKSARNRIITALNGYDVKFYHIYIKGSVFVANFVGEGKRNIERLDKVKFELITRHNPVVENFIIIYKPMKWTKSEIIDFINLFKVEYATKQANIWIYDSKVDKSILMREPMTLSDDEYNDTEKHKIAEQCFSNEINFEKHYNLTSSQ